MRAPLAVVLVLLATGCRTRCDDHAAVQLAAVAVELGVRLTAALILAAIQASHEQGVPPPSRRALEEEVDERRAEYDRRWADAIAVAVVVASRAPEAAPFAGEEAVRADWQDGYDDGWRIAAGLQAVPRRWHHPEAATPAATAWRAGHESGRAAFAAASADVVDDVCARARARETDQRAATGR